MIFPAKTLRPLVFKISWNRRRVEIVEDFDREVYGRVSRIVPRVRWEVVSVAAGPVYSPLGKKDLETTEFPAIETALIDRDIAWRQHIHPEIVKT